MVAILILILILILQIASFVFVARAILSWFPIGPDSFMYPVLQAVHRITEPVLAPIRRVLPRMGGFDFSPVMAILAINLLLIPVAAVL